MNFVSCVKWVKQGTAKSEPDKVRLSAKELESLLEENEAPAIGSLKKSSEQQDEFNFDDYDEEDDSLKPSLQGVAVYDKKTKKKRPGSDSDSEKEDEIIKPDDNLLLVSHIDDEQSSLEVYVYNYNDDDMYVHHDIMLSNTPLCVEPLSYSSNSESNNLCVIGGMHPVLEVWDLDIIGCVEPVFKLGRFKNKNPEKNYGHTDPVLDIAWNKDLSHILASASVDQKVLLWDLDNGSVSTTLSDFQEKVQSICWSPYCSSNLLTGCADKFIRNYDCRVYNTFQSLELSSSVEKVTWGEKENIFYAGTESGEIYIIDVRQNEIIDTYQAHSKEITGIIHSTVASELLITSSTDEMLKIWNISEKPKQICSKNCRLDALQCLDSNPDLPFLLCVGGTTMRKNKNIKVINLNTELCRKEETPQTEATTSSFVAPSNNEFDVPLLEDAKARNKPELLKMKVKSFKQPTYSQSNNVVKSKKFKKIKRNK